MSVFLERNFRLVSGLEITQAAEVDPDDVLAFAQVKIRELGAPQDLLSRVADLPSPKVT